MNCKEKTDNGNKIFVLKVFFVEYKGSYKKNLLSPPVCGCPPAGYVKHFQDS